MHGLTMKHGRKPHNGDFAGRDPRELTPDDLREAGHEPMSPLRALRARCSTSMVAAACAVIRSQSLASFRNFDNSCRVAR